ncbi:hypothetical protein HT746_15115 [Burkholderia pyrrocinia]|uniref:hypothetical protein n=1 Tax=Burkholderia pyrrocinia TaxID=60550 RepID=UPI00157607AA|nr:hypothetical protein [Burkholderia pyrrocinia]NTX28446.1 hypothetical protein [Burkholderia pyrrocinia]
MFAEREYPRWAVVYGEEIFQVGTIEIHMKTWATILAEAMVTSLSDDAVAKCQGSQNRPSRQFFVAFDENSDRISVTEANRLRKWASDMNSEYPIQNWIDVIGGASENEKESDRLAMRRAVAVAKDAIGDGLVRAPLQMNTQISPAGSVVETSAETREVIVQISPGCANNCCDGH